MVDAKRLLDHFLGGQSGRRAGTSRGGGFDGNQLGELARTLGGGALGGRSSAGGTLAGLGGVGGGTLAGGLAGVLLGSKRGRKLGGSALSMGGMAVVGALAYKAYQDWQAGQQPGAASAGTDVPPPSGTPFNPASEADQQSLSRRLLGAMIAAAKADGHIDAAEQANIFGQMDALDLTAEDKAFVVDQLRAPLDVDAVAKSAGSPEEAAEIYTASLLAIDVDNAAERGYLGMLAARLDLDDSLVQHLHATVEKNTEALG